MTRSISILSSLGVILAFQVSISAQTITNQPRSVIVNNASTAEFTVGATNATSFQWKFGGTNLTDGGGISGSTTSTLTLEDVNSNQMGNYSVVLNGSVTSSNATLTVSNGTIVTIVFSGFIGGGTSNVDLQLFDHDKPATVQNFLHYITSGGYLNMFIHRDDVESGFGVIQAGAFGASNRTSATAPITGWLIPNIQPNPPFPKQLENESGVGPVIHNRFGTIAMAFNTTNSATSSFFFNTFDNSAGLDPQGFTVFGRILDGTNVLDYFNTLTAGKGIFTGAAILTNGSLITNTFPMPVNYISTNAPGNDNLFFCDFLLTNAPLDTNPPTVAITSPAAITLETNSNPVVQGTAGDDIGLADIFCVLTPQAAADGTFPNGNVAITNFATGTSNWSATLGAVSESIFGAETDPVPPGVYELGVESQDGAGNLSPAAVQPLTNTAILVQGNGTVSFVAGASLSNNPVGYPFQIGTNYEVLATPATNSIFVNWGGRGYYSTDPDITFAYGGVVFTATFISNNEGGVAITFPANDVTLSNNLFNVTGTINTSVLTPPVTVTCQIFTNSSSNFSATLPQSTVATNAWTIPITNYLPTGSYIVQVLATDASSNQTLVTTNFNFIADTTPPTIAITSPSSGATLFVTNSLFVQGTAGDGIVPLASVNCSMIPITEPDGMTPQEGFTNVNASGTTNWIFYLTNGFGGYVAPGRYSLVPEAVDGAGNTNAQTNLLTLSAIATNGNGTVTLSLASNALANPIGYPLQYGTTYTVKATPAPGYEFLDWSYALPSGVLVIPNAEWSTFQYVGGRLTANFLLTNTPRGTKGIAFTYPPRNSVLFTNNFSIKGTVIRSVAPAAVTVQVFSLYTGEQVARTTIESTATLWSVPLTNMSQDVYEVIATASNSSGFSSAISEIFEVLAYKPLAGTYNGLFICNNGPITPTNSGFFTFHVSSLGEWSGTVFFPAYGGFGITDLLDIHGQGQGFFSVPKDSVHMTLFLDLAPGANDLSGTISSEKTGGWVSPYTCYRTDTKLSTETTAGPGKYVLSLDPTNWGNTNGYAAITVSKAGIVAAAGVLPDGAAFTHSSGISSNGLWPLYAVPTGYGGKGMILGWQTIGPSNSLSGQLNWTKGSNFGTYYTGGVMTNLNVTGTNYVAPAAGNYSIVFAGGSLAGSVTNNLTVARAGAQFKPVEATDKLAIAISANGVITGHFVPPETTKAVQFKGIFLSQEQGGSGIVLDSGNRTGFFLLEPQ